VAETDPTELKRVVESQHGGVATLVLSVPIDERHDSEPVWQGIVHVFDLAGHAEAKRAYAWSLEDGKDRFYTVLHLGPVTGPVEAVRATIAAEQRMSYPIIEPPPGSMIVFKMSLSDSEEWLELKPDGTLLHHCENAGGRMLKWGIEEKKRQVSVEEAKYRWPIFADEIDRALSMHRPTKTPPTSN